MRGCDFIFDSVQVMYYKCHRVNFMHHGSYINSPDCIKKKKRNNKPKNTDDKCFQYVASVALNYEEIESHPETVLSIKTPISKYNQKGINDPSKIDDQKTLDKNNLAIARNILYTKEKEICPAYVSDINMNCEKQIIPLMIFVTIGIS